MYRRWREHRLWASVRKEKIKGDLVEIRRRLRSARLVQTGFGPMNRKRKIRTVAEGDRAIDRRDG